MYAQAKYDGIWLEISPRALAQAWTSQGNNVASQLPEHILNYANEFHSLLGELYVSGKPASEVKSCMADVYYRESLRFACFAVPTLLPHMQLEGLRQCVENWGVPFAPFMYTRVRVTEEQSPESILKDLNRFVMVDGNAEGIVFKDANLLGWQKWKPVQTVDCVVTGTKDGNGKYLGLIGALEVSVHFIRKPEDGPCHEHQLMRSIAHVSGMDDAVREEMSLAGHASVIGRVCEVAYQYVGSGGRLRHPRFIRWRDDKSAADCTEDQLL